MDHIYPLSLGGKHEEFNIKVSCQHCNVTKSSKHPIAFAIEKNLSSDKIDEIEDILLKNFNDIYKNKIE